jgi:hypothetical protein
VARRGEIFRLAKFGRRAIFWGMEPLFLHEMKMFSKYG